MITIEYIDDYNQRYVTSSKIVTLGTEVTTEIYTPYVYGYEISTRKLENSVEVFGTITIITQVFNKNKELIAEGTTFDVGWIEIWKKCWSKPANNFKYNLNYMLVDAAEGAVSYGSAFVSQDSTNNVVWGDLAPDGSVIPSGTGEINLELIDVWS